MVPTVPVVDDIFEFVSSSHCIDIRLPVIFIFIIAKVQHKRCFSLFVGIVDCR